MHTVHEVIVRLEELAPLALAEEWDNVGLLVGDRGAAVERLMSCLTLTPTTAQEAIDRQADMVLVHHPLPFRPLSRVTTDTTVGRLLWELIGARVAIYSAHTAFDSASDGINERLAAGLGLGQLEPLTRAEMLPQTAAQPDRKQGSAAELGAGRCGTFESPIQLAELARRVKSFLAIPFLQIVGSDEQPVRRAAIACGSGGSLLPAALAKDCDCLITGEASFHHCLEAEANGLGLILAGHFASERFAMEYLAGKLAGILPNVEIWASERELDPLRAF